MFEAKIGICPQFLESCSAQLDQANFRVDQLWPMPSLVYENMCIYCHEIGRSILKFFKPDIQTYRWIIQVETKYNQKKIKPWTRSNFPVVWLRDVEFARRRSKFFDDRPLSSIVKIKWSNRVNNTEVRSLVFGGGSEKTISAHKA